MPDSVTSLMSKPDTNDAEEAYRRTEFPLLPSRLLTRSETFDGRCSIAATLVGEVEIVDCHAGAIFAVFRKTVVVENGSYAGIFPHSIKPIADSQSVNCQCCVCRPICVHSRPRATAIVNVSEIQYTLVQMICGV